MDLATVQPRDGRPVEGGRRSLAVLIGLGSPILAAMVYSAALGWLQGLFVTILLVVLILILILSGAYALVRASSGVVRAALVGIVAAVAAGAEIALAFTIGPLYLAVIIALPLAAAVVARRVRPHDRSKRSAPPTSETSPSPGGPGSAVSPPPPPAPGEPPASPPDTPLDDWSDRPDHPQ